MPRGRPRDKFPDDYHDGRKSRSKDAIEKRAETAHVNPALVVAKSQKSGRKQATRRSNKNRKPVTEAVGDDLIQLNFTITKSDHIAIGKAADADGRDRTNWLRRIIYLALKYDNPTGLAERVDLIREQIIQLDKDWTPYR